MCVCVVVVVNVVIVVVSVAVVYADVVDDGVVDVVVVGCSD